MVSGMQVTRIAAVDSTTRPKTHQAEPEIRLAAPKITSLSAARYGFFKFYFQ
jgi:hypothetical protein